MNLIAVQPYIKVRRQIVDAELTCQEEERKIYLYQDRMVTRYREFPTHDILDVSFRNLGKEGGLLYVHTVGGIYSYTVHSSPKAFIEAFRRYIKKEYF